MHPQLNAMIAKGIMHGVKNSLSSKIDINTPATNAIGNAKTKAIGINISATDTNKSKTKYLKQLFFI